MKLLKVVTTFFTAIKSVWIRGNPFAVLTAMWPTNDQGKYIIQAEGIRLAFTNHGGALTNLWINDTNGQEIDVVMGLDDPGQYPLMDSNPWLNGVIGRYAGYMSGAYYTVGNDTYNVTGNAHNGTTLFNGGDAGWGRQTWDVAAHMSNSITMVLFDRMWNGFPGVFASCITHTVTPYEWRIAFGVTPLRRPGPINLAQQVFFNLDGFRALDNDTTTVALSQHALHLPSSGLRFGFDELGLSTGDLLRNKQGTEHDFWSSPRELGSVLHSSGDGGGYDETFHISRKPFANKEELPVAILSSASSRISLEVFGDRDALHVQTWPGNAVDAIGLKRGQGTGKVPHQGAVSLEVVDWPDAVHHPEWRDRQSIWGSDNLYTSYSTYKFTVARNET